MMPISPAEKLVIARTAHEINRAWCQAQGDESQPAWEDAPQGQKDSALLGVDFYLENPDAGPGGAHSAWMQQKERDGWIWAPVKDPENKQDPDLVPFEQLPREQQAKDYLFRAVVHTMADAVTDLRGQPAAAADPVDRRTHIEWRHGA